MDKPHKKLSVWQKAVDLAILIYQITDYFPIEEKYGLISQMRRAVVSIPSNIAEGAARTSKKELLQFLSIARGSLSELDTQLEIAMRLKLIDDVKKAEVDSLMVEVDRLIFGFFKSVKNSSD